MKKEIIFFVIYVIVVCLICGCVNKSQSSSKKSVDTPLPTPKIHGERAGVVIGDSIALGLGYGRIYDTNTGVEWNSSYVPISGSGASYASEMQSNHTDLSFLDWRYNMGWGGDTTTGVKKRWLRDAIGQKVSLSDGLPDITLDKQPSVIILNVGINDIYSGIAASTIKRNIWYCVADANSRGIPIVVVSIFPESTHSAAIQEINAWESSVFQNNMNMPNVRWVDAYTFLDDGTGKIKSQYDTGDHVHINPSGFVDLTSKIYDENQDIF